VFHGAQRYAFGAAIASAACLGGGGGLKARAQAAG
jgi:hypothetical protein